MSKYEYWAWGYGWIPATDFLRHTGWSIIQVAAFTILGMFILISAVSDTFYWLTEGYHHIKYNQSLNLEGFNI